VTHFEVVGAVGPGCVFPMVRALPLTGRTHQIRVHAAALGMPVLGDSLYGGGHGSRVFLHAARLEFEHPSSGQVVNFKSEPPWTGPKIEATTEAQEITRPPAHICSVETDGYRVVQPSSSALMSMERLGSFVLLQSELAPDDAMRHQWGEWQRARSSDVRGVYHKRLIRQLRGTSAQQVSPELIAGEAAPDRFHITENGLRFELSFKEGYSVGLFLDQRDNRRRWKCRHVSGSFGPMMTKGDELPEMLNTFAYTCGFSVAAASGGWRTTSLDLSKKYLEWGRRNFEINNLNVAAHDFVYGDVFDWLKRWAKKGRRFEGIVLDPPTFSMSKERGRFSAEANYGELVTSALQVLSPGGLLFTSTNAARVLPEQFVALVRDAVRSTGRRIEVEHYVPQPPDFPISRDDPAYLKTLWLRVS
jgi:23S rRNA (cytosine1962-C5)-methyltransferase